jgi:hypothetical protein
MTYNELVAKIRSYTEVSNTVLTDSVIDGFISDSEFRILRDVDSDNNRKYATTTFIVNQKFLNLPDNLLVIRNAEIVSGEERTFLQIRDTSFIDEYNQQNTYGRPKYYANWDENIIVLAPIPDQNYTIEVNYILKPTGLSATNQNTYLSQQFPNGLLYACLVEAYGFLKGPMDLLQFYENKYKQAIEGFSLEQMGRRRTDEYLQGEPRISRKQQ